MMYRGCLGLVYYGGERAKTLLACATRLQRLLADSCGNWAILLPAAFLAMAYWINVADNDACQHYANALAGKGNLRVIRIAMTPEGEAKAPPEFVQANTELQLKSLLETDKFLYVFLMHSQVPPGGPRIFAIDKDDILATTVLPVGQENPIAARA